MRVLVVEDNANAGDALRMLLETGGHDVAVARTITDAVQACTDAARNGRRIDLMLLDLTLPNGDGLDVLAGVSAADAAPAATIALTGWDERAVAARCRAAGCRDVLIKPVPGRQLLALAASLAR